MPKGFKQCPKCNVQVGPRLRICECGHTFVPKGRRVPAENPTGNPPPVVSIKDREALKTFINQLKAAYTKSDRAGGCYAAFLHHRHGVLQVDVWLEMRAAR